MPSNYWILLTFLPSWRLAFKKLMMPSRARGPWPNLRSRLVVRASESQRPSAAAFQQVPEAAKVLANSTELQTELVKPCRWGLLITDIGAGPQRSDHCINPMLTSMFDTLHPRPDLNRTLEANSAVAFTLPRDAAGRYQSASS